MNERFDVILQRRINWVLLFFYILIAVLLGRLFLLQIVHHRDYVSAAARQHTLVQELVPERGLVYLNDRGGERVSLALNRTYADVIASPKNIHDPEIVAGLVADILGLGAKEHEELFQKLSKINDPHEVIAKKIDKETVAKLKALHREGISFEEETRRIYPLSTFAAQSIGFVSKEEKDEVGRYGIERFYEKELAGKTGFFEGMKDASGFLVALGRRIISPPSDGSNLLLTLDYNIQTKVEEVAESLRETWQPRSLSILITDPVTGKVLALASLPNFNPNEFSKVKDFSVFLNPIVESRYELGSVIKPITVAAGIEEKLISPETTYKDTGEVKIGGYTIKNFDLKAHGVQTMMQVLEKSLNTGAVYVAGLLGKEREWEYFSRFGLGEKTNIDLPGEVSGDIANLSNGYEIDYATASFGQGIAVTPIALASAFGAIANGGKLLTPYIVEKIFDSSGNETERATVVRRDVISPATAETVTKMLVSAVQNGFENRAGVKGYFVAGKTGTAQIPRSDGKGYSDKVIHTFIGYAPAFQPRFLIFMQLNEPLGNRFAANTLTPVFHTLAEFILHYYEIPPDER